MKSLAHKSLKIPILLRNLFRPKDEKGLNFLIYHNISGNLSFELDMPLPTFRRQLEYLARTQRVVSYHQALQILQAGIRPSEERFVLTFDDGYREFYTHVFPLLCRFKLPAILFVTTGFVETGIPYPLLSHPKARVNPVNWDMLAEMVESGLVTVGAHTHTHPVLINQPEERVIEELEKPKEIFRSCLGLDAQHFAYPKALWNETIEPLVAKYYLSAVICNEKKALSASFHPYRIPRIPIRRSDGWFFFLAKIHGWLEGEEAMYDKLRRFRNNKHRAKNGEFQHNIATTQKVQQK